MIYYTKSGIFYCLGQETERSTPYKLCLLKRGDIVVCVNSVKFVLSEINTEFCFVLAVYKSRKQQIKSIHRELYLHVPLRS